MLAKSVRVHVLLFVLGDCTNHGVTSKFKRFTLYASREAYDSDGRKDPETSLVVVGRDIGKEHYIHCVPAVSGEGCGPMAGGNYVYTSDSRYAEVTGIRYPIAVHDRWESWEYHRVLSL